MLAVPVSRGDARLLRLAARGNELQLMRKKRKRRPAVAHREAGVAPLLSGTMKQRMKRRKRKMMIGKGRA